MRKLWMQIATVLLLFVGVSSTHNHWMQPSGVFAAQTASYQSSAPANPAPMQPFISTVGRFTINFPQAEVKSITDPLTYKDGSTGTLYEFTVEVDGGNIAYMVMYNDYSGGQANGAPQTLLAQARDGAASGKTLLSDMAIDLNGVPGREFTCKDDTWNYTARQFLKEKRLYQLIIVSKPDHPATQTSDFLNSFKIL
jgi:hypothetical protein